MKDNCEQQIDNGLKCQWAVSFVLHNNNSWVPELLERGLLTYLGVIGTLHTRTPSRWALQRMYSMNAVGSGCSTCTVKTACSMLDALWGSTRHRYGLFLPTCWGVLCWCACRTCWYRELLCDKLLHVAVSGDGFCDACIRKE
jgi:hypothetical protein